MENKNLLNSVVSLAAVVFAGTLIYIATNITPQKDQGNLAKVPKEKENTAAENLSKEKKEWEDFIPEIREEIKKDFKDEKIDDRNSVSVYEKNDITGDGVPEALISLGNNGAYTSEIVLMRFEDGKPTIPMFKKNDGKISYLTFLDGASAMNGEVVKMLPDKNAAYSGNYAMNAEGKLEVCEVFGYLWNRDAKIFEYNKTLSNETQTDFCGGLKNKPIEETR